VPQGDSREKRTSEETVAFLESQPKIASLAIIDFRFLLLRAKSCNLEMLVGLKKTRIRYEQLCSIEVS
jgi:hypothetical protein